MECPDCTASLPDDLRQPKPDPSAIVLGERLLESGFRSFRSMAHLLTGEARINMVDRANAVRPRTLV